MTENLLNYIEEHDTEAWPAGLLELPAITSHPFMEKLVAETHSAALMTAAITSVVNAFKEPCVPHEPQELKGYIPDPTGMIAGMNVLARDAQLSVDAREAITAFFAHLEPCQVEMDRYFSDARALGADRAMALHRYSLASTWRLVCHSAADAVHELAKETEDRLPDLYNLSAGILQRLLDAAARGQSPCLNADGKPYLPALPQRRRVSRHILHQPATLETANYAGRVFVRDVSQGGMGLERARRIKEGDVANVTLDTGRTLTGTVVWRKGPRAGLRFAQPLAPNDPMLWG